MFLWMNIVFATILIQIPNLIAISKFSNGETSFTGALYIGLISAPTAILSTSFYSYYYGAGNLKYSYPMLSVCAYGISLITSFLIHHFYLKDRELFMSDYFSILFVLIGLLIMIFRENINNLKI